MIKQTIEDRMKLYEAWSGKTAARVLPQLPAVARIDGKNFSKFTDNLGRPYDIRLSDLMGRTTTFLVHITNACIGYTQSDEITLIWGRERPVYFDGRINKVNSILAAKTSVFFNYHLEKALPEKYKALLEGEDWDKAPVFDCRLWSVPSEIEACNVLLWRELDAVKNSISMAAQAHFSHKQLHGKHTGEMQDMLFKEKGINWNDYPAFFKRGRYIQHRTVKRAFSTEELASLPPRHAAHNDPGLEIARRTIVDVDMPVFTTISNKEDVVFSGALPESKSTLQSAKLA